MITKRFMIALATLLVGCQTRYTEPPPEKTPDYAAIANAANQATHQFMTKLSEEQKADNLIPKKFWGEAIEQLNPIRVEFDRVNVAIVISENKQSEEGYYFVPMISSYLPFDKKNVTFEALTTPEEATMDVIFGDLSYYKKRIIKENKL